MGYLLFLGGTGCGGNLGLWWTLLGKISFYGNFPFSLSWVFDVMEALEVGRNSRQTLLPKPVIVLLLLPVILQLCFTKVRELWVPTLFRRMEWANYMLYISRL